MKINPCSLYLILGGSMVMNIFTTPLLAVELKSAESKKNTISTLNGAIKAKAVINPTKGNKAKGVVTFTEVKGGVKIVADLEGLSPGKHGLHVHEFGDCSAPDGSSTGDHYNPTDNKHGSPDSEERHAGDFGNITADKKGKSHFERVDTVITLSGSDTIIGRSVVVHSGEDDLTSQPSGNSGAKIGCGKIIEIK